MPNKTNLHARNLHSKLSHASILLLVGSGVVFSGALITGCSNNQSRSNSDTLSEMNPAIAYSKRRHAEALQHYQTASALHLDDQPEEALAQYRKALELDNKLYAAWNNMGQLLMEQKNYADAVSAFKVASGLESSDPRPQYNMGIAYQRLGWGKDSFEHFEAALERDSNYLPALRGAIRAADMLGAGTEPILGYIKTAQLRETDDEWRDYLSTQYYRVQALVK